MANKTTNKNKETGINEDLMYHILHAAQSVIHNDLSEVKESLKAALEVIKINEDEGI